MTSTRSTEIDQQIEELPDEVLECRDMRHDWPRKAPFVKVTVEGGPRGAIYLERVLTCEWCGLYERVELWRFYRKRLTRVQQSARYKPGYQIKGAKKSDNVLEKCRLERLIRQGIIR